MNISSVIGIAFFGVVGSAAMYGDSVSRHTQGGEKIAKLQAAAPFDWGVDTSGPLCGIYAACRAVEMIGLKCDPRNYIASKYVGDCGGSSPEELAGLVEDAGAQAHILTRLSAIDLWLSDCPVIANVRISPTSDRFDHWVVAIPSDQGITVYDGLQAPYDISTAAFLGSWSGLGVYVTRKENQPLISIWLGRSALLLAVGVAGVLAIPNRRRGALQTGKSSIFRQCFVLLIISVVLSVAGNLVFGDLANHVEGVAVATAANQSAKYKLGSLDDAEKASESPNALLVDARREQDYQLGTIEGAVNIPISASIWAIQKYLENLDRNTAVVVFCQSARCKYDEVVGAQICALGFTDVTVCDEGWSEFKEYKKKAMSIADD